MSEEPKRLALIKNQDRYVFCYDQQSKDQLLATFALFAEDDSLNFDAFDASILAEQIEAPSPRS